MSESIVSKAEVFLAQEVKTVEEAVIHLADLLGHHKAVVAEKAATDPATASVEASKTEVAGGESSQQANGAAA
jgi:hypothetical protein